MDASRSMISDNVSKICTKKVQHTRTHRQTQRRSRITDVARQQWCSWRFS